MSPTRKTALLLATTLVTTAQATTLQATPTTCYADLAATRNFTLGLPTHATPTPDGQSILFLRSAPRDTTLHLFQTTLKTSTTTELARPSATPEHLSTQEKARRERARQSLTGITDIAIAPNGQFALATQGGTLERIDLTTHTTTPLPGTWIAPRLSPNAHAVAVVKDNDLYTLSLTTNTTTRLTHTGSETLTNGLAEFAAAEELQRPDGTWWSPDSQTLLYEQADTSPVEKHYIANPGDPAQAPTEFRYPRAGTPNARIKLGLIPARGGKTTWVAWDSTAYPYLGRVVWRPDGGLMLVVQNRTETEERLLSVDPKTGTTRTLLTNTDTAWVGLTPQENSGGKDLPYALPHNAGFLWAAQPGPHWQLELHHPDGTLARILTPQPHPFYALNDYDPTTNTIVITTNPDRLTNEIDRISLTDGTITTLATEPGLHHVTFTDGQHDIFTDTFSSADGTRRTLVRNHTGKILATLPSVAETPTLALHTEFTTSGPQNLDTLIIHPDDYQPGRHYPTLLSVYAGPGYKTVYRTPASYYEDQCLANHGYVVVSFDGRGTPGRDHDFERAIKNNLIDIPLHDQIEGLQSAAKTHPEMDLSRTGVFGWSFGGYFTAMATIRRPDIFKAGNAGAPPVDWSDYDTAYTERYLGTPQSDPEGYRISNVLTYAPKLSRPLLLMHGLTDDNVYFENTMKLTQALTLAGKPYSLMLLPGTHMLPNPVLRARVNETRTDFFNKTLKP